MHPVCNALPTEKDVFELITSKIVKTANVVFWSRGLGDETLLLALLDFYRDHKAEVRTYLKEGNEDRGE